MSGGELVPSTEVQRLVCEALERTDPGMRVVVVVVPSTTPAEMPAALVRIIQQQQLTLDRVLEELVEIRREQLGQRRHHTTALSMLAEVVEPRPEIREREPEEQPTALERATFHLTAELRDHVEASYKRLRREGKARARREGARK